MTLVVVGAGPTGVELAGAIAEIATHTLGVLWWAVHIALLIGFRSRALVRFGWGWSWLTFRRGARLIRSRWQPVS